MAISITATPSVLVEEEGTEVTLTISSDEPIPEGGLVLTVSSDTVNALGQFDVLAAQPSNVQILGVTDDTSGFRVRLNEQTGTITLPVFDDSDEDSPLDLTFSVEPGEGYTVDENAGSVTLTIEDAEGGMTTPPDETPDETLGTGSGLPLVSLNTGPNYLVEADGTVSAHVFNVTGGTIPEGGIVVVVNAPNLSEFDLDGIQVGDGGEIVNVREDGFDIRLTDFTVLVDLPVAADGEAEGLETASFTLEAGDGYEVNEGFSSGSFEIVDTAEEIPSGSFTQLNDTIPLAIPVELSEDNPTVTLTDAIDFNIGNRYLNDDGTYTYIDVTEDVDFYSLELSAGDVISIDLDSDSQRGEPPATVPEYQPNYGLGPFGALRILDGLGNELEADWQSQGPGELFTAYDGYLEFVAPENGTYYLAVSGATNGAPNRSIEIEGVEDRRYNPFVPGSGNDESYPDSDTPNFGGYDLTVNLNPDTILELPQFLGDAGSSIINNSGSNSNGDEPTVSLDFLTATFDPDSNDDLLSPYIVEELPNGGGALVLNFQTEGEIPEEGILVNVSSDNYLREYVSLTSFWFPPFTPGGELETLLYDETGRETGFQFRIFEPNTYISLLAGNEYWGDVIEPDVDEPEDVSFFLEAGEGYSIDSDNNEITATYYDSLETVPTPSVIPEIGISISETQLIESQQTVATLTFNLSEPPTEEGVIVQVNGTSGGLLSQFDIFAIEIDGGILPYPNLDFSGFFFKITEQEASITLPVFEDPFDEGLQSYSFSLAEAPNYTIASDASEATFTITDNPDSVLEVSLSSESEILVESENPTGVLTFNLTAEPAAEGVTVTVDAPEISEFDADALTVTGGEITEITDSGFSLNITDATATVELPVLADGEAEGLETATFTLAETAGSTINPDTNEATIVLADSSNQIPITEEIDFNDNIAEADDLNLSPENANITIRGNLFTQERDYPEVIDLGEDVDIYTFDLEAGDTVKVDVDAVGELELSLYEGVDLRLDSELRLFDAEGNELASVNNAAAPDEEFSRDPYLEFTAEEAGSYYVGVSQLGNRNYDPNVEGSGSGWIFPEIGVFAGVYDLNVSLTPASSEPIDEAVFNFEWTGQIAGFSVEGQFSYDENQTYEAGIVREEDLLSFDVSFFDPDGNLLRTYTDNQDLSRYPTFNFAFDTQTQEILQDGTWDVDDDINLERNGFMFGEGNPDLRGMEDAQSGLAFWTRPSDDKLPHLHVDDWNDELGFPIGYSTHEDVSFPTLTVAELIDNGKVGETYLESVQDSLDELGKPVVVSVSKNGSEGFMPVFGTVEGDVIEVEGTSQLIFGGDSDDLIDASISSGGDNRIYAGSGDDTLILGNGDRLVGGAGNDKFFALSGGDNILTGGAGADQFWIATAETPDAANIITDFTSGEDVLGIAGLGIGFDDLSITEQDGNTLIATNNSELAILQGVGADNLIADNFAFG